MRLRGAVRGKSHSASAARWAIAPHRMNCASDQEANPATRPRTSSTDFWSSDVRASRLSVTIPRDEHAVSDGDADHIPSEIIKGCRSTGLGFDGAYTASRPYWLEQHCQLVPLFSWEGFSMTSATWYFDFISPFAYLQFSQLGSLRADLDITLKPILFSALLKHWGQKGPAEIDPKRRFVYRFLQWQADRRGVPFSMPPIHPFNPLPPLRLAIAAGASFDVVYKIFHWTYGQGRQLATAAEIAAFVREANLEQTADGLADQKVKDGLRVNTEEAISSNLFGVPSFLVAGEVFWGDDATEMLRDFIKDRTLFDSAEMQRLSTMSMGTERT